MISPREAALLQCAATIYAGVVANNAYDSANTTPDLTRGVCVDAAYKLLDLIQSREKAAYQTREGKCCDPTPPGGGHYTNCIRYGATRV